MLKWVSIGDSHCKWHPYGNTGMVTPQQKYIVLMHRLNDISSSSVCLRGCCVFICLTVIVTSLYSCIWMLLAEKVSLFLDLFFRTCTPGAMLSLAEFWWDCHVFSWSTAYAHCVDPSSWKANKNETINQIHICTWMSCCMYLGIIIMYLQLIQ